MAWQDKKGRKKDDETAFKSSILKTLTYSDFFNYPLTKKEISKWLIKDDFTFSQEKLDNLLKKMVSEKEIGCLDGFYFLKNRKQLVKQRQQKQIFSKEKLIIAQQTAKKLRTLPWIKMIGITGALSMKNCQEEDDIDLIVITDNYRLWLTRFMILISAPILNIKRRKPRQNKVKDKICFNLFLEVDHLKMPSKSLFLAHEISQIIPLVNNEQTFEKLLNENQWIGDFLLNILDSLETKPLLKEKIILTNNFFSLLLSFLNKALFNLQYLYMKPRITNEKVSLHQAFFHPRNFEQETREKIIFLKEK